MPVRIAMKKHLFGFGSAINAALIQPDQPNAYMEKIKELFNKSVIENHLKWRMWNEENAAQAVRAVDWLNSQGIEVRGHCLVWPAWGFMPGHVSRTDPALLQKQVLDHIDEVSQRFKGKLPEWDVLNEAFMAHDAIDMIGPSAVPSWFHRARANLPDVKLYINDFEILSGGDEGHQNFYYDQIEGLIRQGVPIDGIGMQSHFGDCPTPIPEVLRRLDRFGKLGLAIQPTEFDVGLRDERQQGEYTRDFLTATFSHPSIAGFLMWGFWEGSIYSRSLALYREDWSIKPNGKAYNELVFDEWWTDVKTRTNSRGACTTRGFKGTYAITVGRGPRAREFELLLDKDTSVTIDQDNNVIVSG
jgi:endo-1,4-beta-xylanase